MAKKTDGPKKSTALRRQAEKRLRTTRRDVAAMSAKDVQQLVHELQVHQIELEMQNDELHRTHAELEAARDRYLDLYDFAPTGHLTLDVHGKILEANLRVATLLGVHRNKLLGQLLMRFIARDGQDTFRRHCQDVLTTGMRQTCEVQLRSQTDVPCWVNLESLAVHEEPGRITHWRTSLLDINDRKRAEAALLEANTEIMRVKERWDWALRATQDGVWDWDLLHGTVYFSPRWKEMHGFQETDQFESAEDWSERIAPEDRTRVMAKLHAYWQKREPQFWEEYRIRRKDGTLIWVLDRGIAVWDERGRVVRMVGSETDITWRKESEEALRRREHEFYTLADNVPAFFGYLGSDQRYHFVNRGYEELFGLPRNEIIGMTMFQLMGPEGYAQVKPHLEAALNGETVSFEYCLPVPGANERWLSARYLPDRDAAGTVAGLFVLFTDITSLKQSEAAIRDNETRLSHLSAKLLQAQEDERRRIARELHDDFTQRLAAVSMELGALSHRQPSVEDQWSKRFEDLQVHVERLTGDLQQLAHELHPSILEHVGLEAAVREHAEEFALRTGLSVEVMVDKVPKSFPSAHAICLYRVLQETLQNIRKHAHATSVLVRLLRTGHGVGLCVHDDGRGFVLGEAGNGMGGLGLTSMAERLGLVNGEFRIRTKPGDGTEVHAWVPIPNEKESKVKGVESSSEE